MKIKMIGNVYLWICLNLLLLLVPHLTWGQTCQFTSPNSTTFVIGQKNSFQVTVDPRSTFIELHGKVPKGVTFNALTGVLSGIPVEGSDSIYPLTFVVSSSGCQCIVPCKLIFNNCLTQCLHATQPDCRHKCEQQYISCLRHCGCACTQEFTLHILSAPCGFTSSNTTTFALEQENTFEITVADSYSGSITYEGDLPAGVSFYDNEDGTATLSGAPASDTTGCYPLTLHFSGSIPDQPDSTCESSQSFLLIVGDAICSPAQPIDFTVMQKEVSSEDRLARAKRKKIKFDNILRWRAPRHRAGIVAYRIYLDRDLQHLALEIPSRDRKRFRAVQRNVSPCKIQKYFLVSVNEFGIESKPVKAKVKMAKHNCSLKKQEHEHSSSSFSSSSCFGN